MRSDEDGILPSRFDVATEDVVYTHADGKPLLGRLYVPSGASRFPALVDVHGGGWGSGDRLQNASLNISLAQAGIGVFALDFRLSSEAAYPASVADVNVGIRWLKANVARWGGDPKVGGLGTSSGGHQLLLNALLPRDPLFASTPLAGNGTVDASLAFVIACWPVCDPVARWHMAQAKNLTNLVRFHQAYFGPEGASAASSPQAILDSGRTVERPPTLLIQGTADANVTPEMTFRFAETYAAAGGRLAMETFQGEPHGFIVQDPTSAASKRAVQLIVDFIQAI